MTVKPAAAPRSGCPVSIALETFGDRWSLLVIRDLMVRGLSSFGEFLASGEGIASNILAERLRRLQAAGVIHGERRTGDGRRVRYRLTEKGIALAPVLLELLIWSARHERTAAPCGFVDELAARRTEVLREVRRRWETEDSTPLLPRFGSTGEAERSARKAADDRRGPAAQGRARARGAAERRRRKRREA